VVEIPWCYHETSLGGLLHSTIYFVGFYKTKFYFWGDFFLFRHQKERMGQCESVLAIIRLQTWSAELEVAAVIPGAEPVLRVLK